MTDERSTVEPVEVQSERTCTALASELVTDIAGTSGLTNPSPLGAPRDTGQDWAMRWREPPDDYSDLWNLRPEEERRLMRWLGGWWAAGWAVLMAVFFMGSLVAMLIWLTHLP